MNINEDLYAFETEKKASTSLSAILLKSSKEMNS